MARTIEINGKRVRLVETAEMTLDELRMLRDLSGMRPAAADDARDEGDPDAWTAFLAVAIKRDNPKADLEKELGRLGSQVLGDLLDTLENEKPPEGDDERPPVKRAGGRKATGRAKSGTSG